MSVLRSRPVLRWLVPATAAVAVIGGGAAVGTFAAEAEPSLPPRTAAQLLVDLQTSRLEGLSGTVVQRADLGLPPLVGLVPGNELTTMLTGTHTLRVWYSGPDQQRVALLDTLGEQDVIRNGRDLWTWQSRTNTATHRTLSGDLGAGKPAPEQAANLPATPQQAADLALGAVDPSTEVSVGRSATVAGQDAYELVLQPRDRASLVHQLRIAIDAERHVPLRFEVLAKGSDRPAFEVAFTEVDYRRPDADQFTFNPPPGVTVTEEKAEAPTAGKPGHGVPPTAGKPGHGDPAGDPKVRAVGSGWTTVLIARLDGPLAGAKAPAKPAAPAGGSVPDIDVSTFLGGLAAVNGDWGSGRLLTSKLFSVLLTDDGRVLAGAVTPERLYEAARG
ncbi:sigma-E factor regulatory protein RseB domain-containing protein [Micromonospora sp. WMMD967]|uniref:LolA family protein n=1 Tax=Micromonospora sp. WMMD967 TaxID=3016101 RepID=UPI0024177E72|nr:sigma-E factor regulatory protein RseB domain-containing protein [Micromonospora sp. WMMD967]MDG4837624.1 sigma-E factor regulatory protein RseB domain-containing protein [Micromonospora sp. WMMD967]